MIERQISDVNGRIGLEAVLGVIFAIMFFAFDAVTIGLNAAKSK